MTFRDREVCEHCGHRFRTGVGTEQGMELGTGLSASPLDAPILDEAALHRTMQFTLPPLPPRGEAAPPASPPETGRQTSDAARRRNVPILALASGAAGLALLGIWGWFHFAPTARAVRPSPLGVWETAPTGRAPQSARLRLVFRDGGGGSFSWAAGGTRPLSGQAPLRWRLNPDGRLVLSIPPPDAAADPSGQMITLFNSHPWLWRVDRTRQRLVIGPLSFTEKP